MSTALSAAGEDKRDDAGACQQPDDPASHLPDRAERAATQKREGRVDRRDRLAPGQKERHAAPDQKTAQGNDEGRNAQIGDNIAVQCPDHRTCRHADNDGDDPDRRVAQAQILGKDPH